MSQITLQNTVSSDLSESGQVLVTMPREAGVCRGRAALLGQHRGLPVHQMEPRSHLGGQVDVGSIVLVRLQKKTQHSLDMV